MTLYVEKPKDCNHKKPGRTKKKVSTKLQDTKPIQKNQFWHTNDSPERNFKLFIIALKKWNDKYDNMSINLV
jgi:hypothetical protein